jgi:hypothetical protein
MDAAQSSWDLLIKDSIFQTTKKKRENILAWPFLAFSFGQHLAFSALNGCSRSLLFD